SKSAPDAAGADPFVPRAPVHRTAGSHLRPRSDTDAGRRAAADRPPRPDRRLRPDHRPSAGLGRVHAAAERHGGACDLVAAGGIDQWTTGGDDVLGAGGPRSPLAGTGLRTRRRSALGAYRPDLVGS